MVWAVHIKKQVILMVWAVIGYLGLQTTSRTCPALFLPLEIEFSEELSYLQPVDKDTGCGLREFQSVQFTAHLRLAKITTSTYLSPFCIIPQKNIRCIVEILE